MKRSMIGLILLLVLPSLLMAQEEEGVVDAESIYATPVIDGEVSDWAEIPPAYIDTIGDQEGSVFDYAEVSLANDQQYLYIRIEFAEPAPFGDSSYLTNLAFNTDLDAGTGYGFAGLTGSEFFIQSGSVFDQRTGQNFVDVYEQTAENNYGAFAFTDMAYDEETRYVELRLRRDLTFSDDENGLPGLLNPDDSPIFPYEDFILLFEAENAEFSGVEFMPNAPAGGGEAGIYYRFAESPVQVSDWAIH